MRHAAANVLPAGGPALLATQRGGRALATVRVVSEAELNPVSQLGPGCIGVLHLLGSKRRSISKAMDTHTHMPSGKIHL